MRVWLKAVFLGLVLLITLHHITHNLAPPQSKALSQLTTLNPSLAPQWEQFREIHDFRRFITWLDYSLQTGPDDLSGDSVRTYPLSSPLSPPIKVYVQQAVDVPILFQHSYLQAVTSALDQWSSALNGRLKYVIVDRPQDANIRVYWVSGFGDTYTCGETEYSIGQADIQIKTAHMTNTQIEANLLHELGHALGISRHSTNNDDIMVGFRHWSSYDYYAHPQLSPQDKLAIQRLYSPYWRPGENLYPAMTARRPEAASIRSEHHVGQISR